MTQPNNAHKAPSGHYVITIGRSFGAGGRELGQILASKLEIGYYDKELLVDAAGRAGMDTGIFAKNDERAPGFFAGLIPMSMGYNAIGWYNGPDTVGAQAVYNAQSDFMREIASRGPCVIVGRTADYVLRDRNDVLNIFLHAPEETCIDRILRRADTDDRNRARSILRKTNRLRAEFYNFYTDRTWGDAASYHLTFDSSAMPMEQIADIVINYLNAFLENRRKNVQTQPNQ